MNNKRELTIILTIIAAILSVACIVSMVMADRKGPNIMIESMDITYTEGDDVTPLLEGVSAFDDVDGDVSESIMVKDITVLNSGKMAKVSYAARDKRNNISERNRVVKYIKYEETENN